MLSATTADNNDSIAPNMAMANAGPISSTICVKVMSGHWNDGRSRGISPNMLPMVATPSNSK